MRRVWQVLRNAFIWQYERGSLPYDLMVIAILLFVFLSPRSWFRDRPRTAPAAHAAEVTLLSEGEAGLSTYRIEAHVVAVPPPAEELEARLAETLRAHIEELRDAPFEISALKPVFAPDGTLSHYEVTIRR
jgi:hypothetical protein